MGGDAHPNERGRLPKRIVFGNLEGAVRRGRSGKEKEWVDCVQSDIRAFGIAGHWKVTVLKAGMWVETAAVGGRRLMTAWGKEEVDGARHCQEKREATCLGVPSGRHDTRSIWGLYEMYETLWFWLMSVSD